MASTSPNIVVAPPSPLFGDWRTLNADRDSWVKHYASIVAADERMKGRVLDIGCGDGTVTHYFREILVKARQIDGIEPSDDIQRNPYLTERWQTLLEDAPVPENAYDAALAFFVLEHVATPVSFMRKALAALRPGGVLYAVTPHARHPFAWIVRTINASGLKSRIAREEKGEKPYPTYYRVNSIAGIRRAMTGLACSRVELHYAPSVQWDHYFPRPLRFLPHLYDRAIGIHKPRLAQLVMFKIEK